MGRKKVMMAMSGGVDSSAAACLLLEEGYDVAGITMCIGVKTARDSDRTCCSPRDIEDAREVCRVLQIPHYVLDFSDEMENLVIKPFIEEYKQGRTPNPCVRCNQYIKFGLLYDKARAMGFDYLATGHYAASADIGGITCLQVPEDREKDQTYFLYSVPAEKLRNILFPLAGYTKSRVRGIAEEKGIQVFKKPDSQDICFFKNGGSEEFFTGRGVESAQGEIVHVNGQILGTHRGIIFYTIGQRRGLGISNPEPLYVVSIDARSNRIIAGERRFLKSKRLIADVVNFSAPEKHGTADARIRYTHRAVSCAYTLENGLLTVDFPEPQDAVTPGQSVVLYRENRVIGGGIIKRVLD